MKCAICKSAVAPRGENKAFPFCSDRCRLVDLGKWLGGEYRVPTNEAPATEGSAVDGAARNDED